MNSTFKPEKINRLMLKISGEILAGPAGFGFDDKVCDQLTDELIGIKNEGYGIAVVLGGGNIFRGGSQKNLSLNRVTLDNIGMLATIQNALYLCEILLAKACAAEVFSSFVLDKIARHYSAPKVQESLAKGKICFLAGGTGNPYFTTDTAAVLRAIELKLDIMMKATKVDGLYSADPMKDANAAFIREANYQTCLERRLGVMDLTAFSLAADNNMPIKIFNIAKAGNLKAALQDADIGTYIHP
ncbi:MAG: UMP kinase [Candidatus Cloacimonadales bacterium]|jgi:uridylate kinase|nr:UMP kinase [Candidatus Cloacimonadota bacterium]MDY0381325.1 UMP kinase [Candidatus Cloacimonadaceae bacterium]MCB5256089.1 UMP kinase [Candidatus Cloacimonadota bacterium]MCB5264427.1 UMP kinase [Candidatus Cloacimonadota bacterium]MCB5277111.1 UMP kinase [Candidatus Cloacimonadota bacterium]